jgi:transposase
MAANSPKKKIGRRSKLTPSLQKKICDMIEAGNYMHHAAQAAGIGKSTLNQWIRKGEEGQEPYAAFAAAVARARAQAVDSLVSTIRTAAVDDWRAASWLLERGHVADFGAKRIEHTGKHGSPIQVESWAKLVESVDDKGGDE